MAIILVILNLMKIIIGIALMMIGFVRLMWMKLRRLLGELGIRMRMRCTIGRFRIRVWKRREGR